jgi:hypothetical protein
LGNYKKFEELPCWQKTRELCHAVSKLINKAKFQKDSNLNGQIWKAAGSAMDNIAEGFEIQNLILFTILRVNVESKLKVLESI